MRSIGGAFASKWEPFRPWQPMVYSAVERSLRDGSFRPDVLVTFGHPWVDHEIGLELKRRLGLPWIAHFSDPWVDNPLVGMTSEAARSALRRREAAVIETAARVIFTSQETVDLVMDNYPSHLRNRTVVLPHCFDDTLFAPRPPVERGVIRCLGKFYGERQPDVLIEALRVIYRERPDILSGIRFEIIGNYSERSTIRPEGVPCLSFRPAVPYLQSLKLMAGAEALFLIDAPSEVSVFLPSKLIEYIGAGRPVFGITPAGTAEDLIRRYGGVTADPSDGPAVVEMIINIVSSLGETPVNDSVRDEFAMESVGRRFDKIVRSCLEPPSGET